MRKAKVLFRNEEAGFLIQNDDGSFIFCYHNNWISDSSKPAISLNFPKEEKEFHSEFLFPFFYNMLPEGTNKEVVCRLNRIDKRDDFGLLMTTAQYDSIGAVRIVKTDDI